MIRVWDEVEIKWIKESLAYCSETGQLSWKARYSGRIREDLLIVANVWQEYNSVAKIFNGKQRTFKAHRIGWFLHYGYQPVMLDHINQNKHDNRIINLRESDATTNLGNQKPKNTLGIKGVGKLPSGNYQARCFQANLGIFDNPIDAAKAYDVEAIKVFGEFAYTNKEHGVY